MLKKITAVALSLIMLASLTACSIRTGDDLSDGEGGTTATTAAPTTTAIETTGVIEPEVFENTEEFWTGRYPSASFIRFTVKYTDEQDNEVSTEYFSDFGYNLCDWVNTEFNVDGWFALDGDTVVSADGEYKIDDSGLVSEGKKFTAEKTNQTIEKPMSLGAVHALNSCSGFKLYGLILNGDLHEKVDTDQYELHGLKYDYFFEENMDIYVDGLYDSEQQGKVDIYCVPHIEEAVLKTVTMEQILNACTFHCPSVNLANIDLEEDTPSCRGNISSSFNEGYYDLLFVYNDAIAYYVTFQVTPPSEAESSADYNY
ncbi:MAG: hypothetical protein K6F64_06215 [Clostridia bacterium]|nr:hypothetical protein [Clostridia bacterium]